MKIILKEVGPAKLAVIKIIKNFYNYGLKETKDLVDKAPVELDSNLSIKDVIKLTSQLSNAGATVETL